MAKAVFLDRDETLNPDPGYISDATHFSLFPWIPAELAKLKAAGFKLIIVSNQSGIGRGLITWDQLQKIHEKMASELKNTANIEVDLIQICPHRPDENCDCRKPKPKLIQEGMEKLQLDAAQCFMIGDRQSDFDAGQNAGLKKSFLIQPGDSSSFKKAIAEILETAST